MLSPGFVPHQCLSLVSGSRSLFQLLANKNPDRQQVSHILEFVLLVGDPDYVLGLWASPGG